MTQLKHNSYVMAGALLATVVAAANGLSLITLIAGGMTIIQFMAWKQQDAVRSRFRAARDAFEALNVIAFDKHWIGSTAMVAKVSSMITPPERLDKPWMVQVLAVTKGGSWFAVDLQVTGTEKVQMLSLHQLSESAAKTMLAFDLEVYERFFGKPDVA
ncbi:hypothetical protein PCI56_05350 [Plesiomonas shigelloides subsp. oncorhynchi]|uniref:hypothetical protein n=1 Tax=Gammaproteobacteria TaxID=1236 RepID=UPI0017D690D8|nr:MULTISPECIES: hypothetical protein [Gammaproteobacteria]MDA1379389.1 hypothetical protein [Plesiomonas shigelloides]EFF6322991.1 hypothetical protein [Escherichia coli]EGK3607921.1 hypothetical protein [Escherichia coli]EHD1573786.1 hypothetical protein [Escherichia coli]EHK7498178.1 hypothetical protein [Escherichia coli]